MSLEYLEAQTKLFLEKFVSEIVNLLAIFEFSKIHNFDLL